MLPLEAPRAGAVAGDSLDLPRELCHGSLDTSKYYLTPVLRPCFYVRTSLCSLGFAPNFFFCAVLGHLRTVPATAKKLLAAPSSLEHSMPFVVGRRPRWPLALGCALVLLPLLVVWRHSTGLLRQKRLGPDGAAKETALGPCSPCSDGPAAQAGGGPQGAAASHRLAIPKILHQVYIGDRRAGAWRQGPPQRGWRRLSGAGATQRAARWKSRSRPAPPRMQAPAARTAARDPARQPTEGEHS